MLLQLQQINTELARQNADLRARYQELQELRARDRAGHTHRLVGWVLGAGAQVYRRVGQLRSLLGHR